MFNTMYSNNPYDTTRPKSFFGDRKKLYVEEITTGSGGRSYNPSWNANRKPAPKRIIGKSNYDSTFLLISHWSFNACILLISVIAVS